MIKSFEIFEFDKEYFIDKEHLENKYLELQMQYHPDRAIGANEHQKMQIISKSADVNQAYEILKNDVKRAEALLAEQNIFVNRERDNSFKPAQSLLIEQMELRELADETQNHDALLKRIEDDFNSSKKEFNKLYIGQNFEQAAQTAMKLKYLSKIKYELEAI